MEKSILITGCSSGIGLSAALTLKQKGYRVFACARRDSDVAHLKTLGFEAVKLDIDDTLSIQTALDEVLKATGGTLYAVFNNSGYVQAGAVEDLSREANRAQFETNVFGPMEVIKFILPIMRKQGYGRIVQNSSMLGIVAMPYVGAYNASKFALDGFTHTLRQELRGSSIFVSIIAPGPISSKLRENAAHFFTPEINHEGSAHREAYRRIEQRYSTNTCARDRKMSLPPEAVVKDLIHALESAHPKSHYYVGMPAKAFAFLRRVLSERMLDWAISRFT
jgi:NAD(P)-dependent dehydrogenase (short-subunit alcohol dehydrogenase family)